MRMLLGAVGARGEGCAAGEQPRRVGTGVGVRAGGGVSAGVGVTPGGDVDEGLTVAVGVGTGVRARARVATVSPERSTGTRTTKGSRTDTARPLERRHYSTPAQDITPRLSCPWGRPPAGSTGRRAAPCDRTSWRGGR